MGERLYCTYIMASRRNGTLYVGVTGDLVRRVWEHREGVVAGFTRQHRVKHLAWFEPHEDVAAAILREKQIKEWKRAWKIELIEAMNPDWRDLWFDIAGEL
jgi:putative endonuclease